MNDLPKISIVIPIRNEARFIANTIRQVLGQDYPAEKIEVVVAIGECTDNSIEIVKGIAAEDSRVRIFPNPIGLSAGGRNVGVKNASGDIIIFIDGHTYINNNQLLRNTIALMNEKGVSVLSRPQYLEPPDNNFFQQAVALARRSIIGHGLDSTIYTDKDMSVDPTSSGASYKREIFDKIGYYDERFDACEDVEFNFRLTQAGYRSFTSMRLAVFYYPRSSPGQLFAQLKRYGIGRFRLARKHRQSLSVGTILPAAFTLGMPLLLIGSLLANRPAYLFFPILALYLLIILAGSAVIAIRSGLRFFPVLLLIYPVIHLGLGWGFLVEGGKMLMGKGISFTGNH